MAVTVLQHRGKIVQTVDRHPRAMRTTDTGCAVSTCGYSKQMLVRCCLMHLVDASQEDPAEAYRVVRGEIAAYAAELDDKPELIVFNKVDIISPDELAAKRKAFEKATGQVPLLMSAATGQGVRSAMASLLQMIHHTRGQEKSAVRDEDGEPAKEEAPWQP